MHIKLLILAHLGEGAFSTFTLEVLLDFPHVGMDYFIHF